VTLGIGSPLAKGAGTVGEAGLGIGQAGLGIGIGGSEAAVGAGAAGIDIAKGVGVGLFAWASQAAQPRSRPDARRRDLLDSLPLPPPPPSPPPPPLLRRK